MRVRRNGAGLWRAGEEKVAEWGMAVRKKREGCRDEWEKGGVQGEKGSGRGVFI